MTLENNSYSYSYSYLNDLEVDDSSLSYDDLPFIPNTSDRVDATLSYNGPSGLRELDIKGIQGEKPKIFRNREGLYSSIAKASSCNGSEVYTIRLGIVDPNLDFPPYKLSSFIILKGKDISFFILEGKENKYFKELTYILSELKRKGYRILEEELCDKDKDTDKDTTLDNLFLHEDFDQKEYNEGLPDGQSIIIVSAGKNDKDHKVYFCFYKVNNQILYHLELNMYTDEEDPQKVVIYIGGFSKINNETTSLDILQPLNFGVDCVKLSKVHIVGSQYKESEITIKHFRAKADGTIRIIQKPYYKYIKSYSKTLL